MKNLRFKKNKYLENKVNLDRINDNLFKLNDIIGNKFNIN